MAEHIVQSLIDMFVCLYYILSFGFDLPGVLLGVKNRSRLWHWHPCSLVAEFGGVLSAAEGSVYHRERSGAEKGLGFHSDAIDNLWTDKPPSTHPIQIHIKSMNINQYSMHINPGDGPLFLSAGLVPTCLAVVSRRCNRTTRANCLG